MVIITRIKHIRDEVQRIRQDLSETCANRLYKTVLFFVFTSWSVLISLLGDVLVLRIKEYEERECSHWC